MKRSGNSFTSLAAPLVVLLGLGAALAPPAAHAAELRVVASTPDLGAIARAVGGERVDVTSIARGTEDPHFVDPKPSHVVSLNRADALVEGGAELEIGWLPKLVESSRNAKLATGAPGRIVANAGIQLREIPTGPVDRSMGDVHPGGNPHYLLDPRNAVVVASTLAERFAALDADGAATYRANAAAFTTDLRTRIQGWEARLASLRGAKVVEYHKLFEYLAGWLGLDIVGQVEPKPGIPPNPQHVAAIEETMRTRKVAVLLATTYHPSEVTAEIARRTGAAVATIPTSVGDGDGNTSYVAMMEQIVAALARAAAAAPATGSEAH